MNGRGGRATTMLAPSSAAPRRRWLWWLPQHPPRPRSLLPTTNRLAVARAALTAPPQPSPERGSLQHVRHLSFGRWLKKKTSEAFSSSSSKTSKDKSIFFFGFLMCCSSSLGIRDETRTLHGETWRDPIAWLEEESSPSGAAILGRGESIHDGHDERQYGYTERAAQSTFIYCLFRPFGLQRCL
ncbi:hypothetical protein QOT17_017427 [Balamuthia mandrillaris]